MRTFRQLVAGTDFSECAQRALDVAIELAASAGEAARVTVVHVCPLGTDEPGDHDEQRLEACEQKLIFLVQHNRHPSVDLTYVLRSGTPWEKLDNVAVEVGATLIVVGRHGSKGASDAALGSVADHLVRGASRPVLTVPPEFKGLPLEAHENNNNQESSTRHE